MRLKTLSAAVIGTIVVGLVVRSHAVQSVFITDASSRRAIYLHHPWLLWTNIGLDILSAISYGLLYGGLWWVIRKLKSIPELQGHLWVLASLNIFILATGITQLSHILIVWWPSYLLSTGLKGVCAAASVPTAILFTLQASPFAAHIRRFFNLLSAERIHGEALRRAQDLLDRTGSLAHVGGWEIELATGGVTWSAQTYRIFGVSPGYLPELAGPLAFCSEEGKRVISAAMDKAMTEGIGWDLELEITRPDDRRIWVRSVGTADFLDGKPIRLIGAVQDVTAQVAERMELRMANERVALATESGGLGIWDWDIIGNQFACDPCVFRLYGLQWVDQQLPLAFWTQHIHPDDRASVVSGLRDAIAGTKDYDVEFRAVWDDATVHNIRATGQVARDSTGRVVRMIGANWDVTERVAERLALLQANESVSLATDSGGIGIWDWDVVNAKMTWDPWMYRLYGMKPKDGLGTYELWREHLHPEDAAAAEQALRDGLRGIDPCDFEFRVIWADGSVRHIRAADRVTRDGTGRALRMIVANWDVTEARRLAADLAEQHELLRITMQSIGKGVITTDATGSVVLLNPVAEQLTGWSNAEALGRPLNGLFALIDEETREPAQSPFSLSDTQSDRRWTGKVILVSRDGNEFSFEGLASSIHIAGRQSLGTVLIFDDATEEHRLAAENERLMKLDLKLKDEFLSHVSHEFRSPLASIYSFTSIVSDGLAGETTPDQQEYLQIVLKNVLQLQSMIEDLLHVTQSREGKLLIDLQCIDTSEAISDAVNTVKNAAAAKQVTLSCAFQARLPQVWADATRLRQTLIILLDNAIKFTPRDGAVTVRASVQDPGFLLVQIADTGCGILPAMTERVFEHMYQVGGPKPGSEGRNGLGIGLHIAKGLVQRQGGEIWVTSAPGEGSVFQFTLPIFSGNCLSAEELEDGARRHRSTDLPGRKFPALVPSP